MPHLPRSREGRDDGEREEKKTFHSARLNQATTEHTQFHPRQRCAPISSHLGPGGGNKPIETSIQWLSLRPTLPDPGQ